MPKIKRLIHKTLFLLNYHIQTGKLKKANKVRIYSKSASLSAQYGYMSLVSKGSTVLDNVILGDYSYINQCQLVKYQVRFCHRGLT